MAATVMELYGSKVFNEHEMRERLPSSTYKSLKATIEKGQPLDLEVANVVASVMKRWAIEQGATHYTHWFQPLTGITSEKHDGFVSPQPDGTAIMEFSGKELIKASPMPPPSPPAAARHGRGPRLHRLGPHQLRLCEGRYAVHSHCVLLLHRRGAGQKDPAAALDAGHL